MLHRETMGNNGHIYRVFSWSGSFLTANMELIELQGLAIAGAAER